MKNMRKLLVLILALTLCVSLALPAAATAETELEQQPVEDVIDDGNTGEPTQEDPVVDPAAVPAPVAEPVVETVYVAQDKNGTQYETLEAAIAAGGTVTLLTDTALSTMITIPSGASVTLDLNGHTITGTDTTSANFSLLDNRGTLVITSGVPGGKMTLTATTNSGWNRYSAVVANNPGGNLTVKSNVTLEHLGGTDMAYGIDNLTNGKGTSAVTTIDGGTVKSTYRAIRQFLNGVEATNTLTINGGTVTGTNKAIFFQDPSKNANSGKLTIGANADINGGVYLFVTEGSTQWPVEVSIAAAALDEAGVTYKNVPNGYDVATTGGTYGVYTGVAKVGNTYYSNLKDAVAADGEVVLVANVSVEDVNGIEITKKVSIDLNGKTVSFNGDGFVVNGGALTVTGEGNVTAANTAGNYVALWAKSGTAVINGGTWSMANLDTTGEGNSLIYTYDGVVTINDGYFQSKNT